MREVIERFNKRKEIIEGKDYQSIDMPIQENDRKYVELMIKEKHQFDFTVTPDEVEDFLEQFKKDFNQGKFDKLISDCKREVIVPIVSTFGIGRYFTSVYDKTGGNVNTIHNVREGVYATEKEKNDYKSREEYDTNKYHKHDKYIEVNKNNSDLKKDGKLKDYMTGDKINPNDKSDLDHVVSAKEIHDDPGRILAGIDGADLANTDDNLKTTNSTINRSKKADTMDDFLERKNKNLQEMADLKSKPNLTEKEENRLKKLVKLEKIDDNKAKEVDGKSRDSMNKKINKEYYQSEKFAKETLSTGATEGAKMGMQQAMGLVIVEFFTALFDEILDIYNEGFSNGFDNDSFFTILKERLKRIADKLMAKWKDVAIAFKDGAISGFISNLLTTAINMFATTAKRMVRIIREGMFSLYRAIKMLLFPPEGMSSEDAMHEAKKLMASGVIISLGVLAEEVIDTMIKTTVALEPFADIITTVFVGAATGLAVTMTVYYIDKKKDDKEMFKHLIADTNTKLDSLFLRKQG